MGISLELMRLRAERVQREKAVEEGGQRIGETAQKVSEVLGSLARKATRDAMANIQQASNATPSPPVRTPGSAGEIMAANQKAQGIAAEFEADRASLKGLTLDAKTDLKRGFVAKYRAHAEAFLSSENHTTRDPVAPWWVIWLWDVGDLPGFIQWAKRAEALSQPSPIDTPIKQFRFYRVIEWVKEHLKAGRSPEPYLDEAMSEIPDMPGDIAWEYFAAAGKAEIRLADIVSCQGEHDPEQVKEHLENAVVLFIGAEKASTRAKVKTVLKDTVKRLESLELAAKETDSPPAGGGDPNPDASVKSATVPDSGSPPPGASTETKPEGKS